MNFNIYYKATVIKTVWNWYKGWLEQQWNENSSVIDPHTYMENWLLTNCKSNSEKKGHYFQQMMLEQFDMHMKKTLIHIEQHHIKYLRKTDHRSKCYDYLKL